MPSFDVVSEVDQHELRNAIDQVVREIGTRYDFKGAGAEVTLAEGAISLAAASEFHIRQIHPMLFQRLAKRGIDVGCLEEGDIEESGQRTRQSIAVREGIDKELARKLTRCIKDSKLKVQASVQGQQLRVSGKKRDDLQQVIALLKAGDWGLPLQYQNFRD